ncbi:MAG: hypothetical protein H7318_20015, partial [Oligoflexus sp.]|nr:hypothetical protein [Oligoflexus sp.]
MNRLERELADTKEYPNAIIQKEQATNEVLKLAGIEILSANEEQQSQQAANQESARYTRSLLEATLDALVTISPDGKITDVNEGSVKITGVP